MTVTLEILGSTVKVSEGIPPEVERLVIEECRFRMDGAVYAPSFQSGEWDGYKNLYAWRKFPVGLISRVETILGLHGVDYKVYDYRETEDPAPFEPPHITLRDYQASIVETAVKNQSGLIQCPTGAGKTIMMMTIMARLGLPAMFIVPTVDLVDQTLEAMKDKCDVMGVHATTNWLMGPEDRVIWDHPYWAVATWQSIHSLIRKSKKADFKKPTDKHLPCMICEDDKQDHTKELNEDHFYQKPSDDYLRRMHRFKEKAKVDGLNYLKKRLSFFDTVVADECHYAGAECVFESLGLFTARHRYGASATPWRTSGDDLRMYAAVGDVSEGITASELIRQGYLTKPIIRFVECPRVKCSDYKKWQTVYREGVVENIERNILIANEAAKLAKEGRITLVMVQQIQHGKIIQRYLNEMFDKDEVFFVNGQISAKKRKEYTQRFHDGEVPVAISSTVWNVGVDHPILSGMVLAGPFKSQITNVQRIGRGLRIHPDKKDVKVIDTWDQLPYLRDWALERHDLYCREPEFEVLKK